MRHLGSFEQAYEMWSRERPMHFCLVAELSGGVTRGGLELALRVVQQRHPLLSARVVDDPDGAGAAPAYFARGDRPISTRVETGARWEDVVGQELAMPFEAGAGPLVRAVLIHPPGTTYPPDPDLALGSTSRGSELLVLTLSHTIADGFSARLVLEDVVSVLNGRVPIPRPLPAPQEALLDQVDELDAPGPVASADGSAVADPGFTTPLPLRRFDPTPPVVTSLAWARTESEELYRRCQVHGVSVNGALVAAAVAVLEESGDADHLRVNIPYSLRDLVPADDDVALYIGGLRPVLSRADRADGVWPVARRITEEAAAAKSPARALQVSAGIRAVMGLDRAAATEQLSIAQGMDLMVSNLGRVERLPAGPVSIEAVWGPAVLSHFEGEQMVGVLTYGRTLRTVHVSHTPTTQLLERIRMLLLTADR